MAEPQTPAEAAQTLLDQATRCSAAVTDALCQHFFKLPPLEEVAGDDEILQRISEVRTSMQLTASTMILNIWPGPMRESAFASLFDSYEVAKAAILEDVRPRRQ